MSFERLLGLKKEIFLFRKKRLDRVIRWTSSNLRLKTELKNGFNSPTANKKNNIKHQSAYLYLVVKT